MKKRLRLGLAICAAVWAGSTGCGGKFQTVGVSPFTGPHPAFSQASIHITVAETNSTDLATEVALLREKMRKQLADRFESLSATDSQGLQIGVHITQLRRVSQMKRIFLGVFAGRAKIVAEVSFTDGASGQLLGSYSVTGTSHGAYGSGLSETEVALSKFAEGVGNLVSEHLSGPS